MAELKPCPFCGDEASIIRTYTDDRQYQVFCGCGGRVAYFDTEEEAIESWNKRVPLTVVNQQGENCTNITNCGTLNLSL